ncbi:hypothetical protein B0H14DRAFT_3895626 [Mycena olivaceomarginata]|nr:hypothetical protein B0H14DRAFT_3895626 [Mycena olivaceomarginata]
MLQILCFRTHTTCDAQKFMSQSKIHDLWIYVVIVIYRPIAASHFDARPPLCPSFDIEIVYGAQFSKLYGSASRIGWAGLWRGSQDGAALTWCRQILS